MTVFVELTTNAFEKVFKDRSEGRAGRRGAGADSVRRPLRGLEIKDDTHAVIRVIRATGAEVDLVNSSYKGGTGPAYTNFILQNVTETREEKTQIVETFGEDYIFFFGERPRMLAVEVALINSLDFNWEAEFWENYNLYLRGTRCAELGARVYMFYDDNIVEGYMISAQASKNAQIPMQVNLQYTMVLTNYSNVSFLRSSRYPVRPMATKSYSETDPEDYEIIGLSTSDNPGWLQPKKAASLPDNRYGGQDVESYRRRTLPIRSDITDNVDEWTGDRHVLPIDWERYRNAERAEAARLEDQAIIEACKRGALADSPGFLRSVGLAGAGADDLVKSIKSVPIVGNVVGKGVETGLGVANSAASAANSVIGEVQYLGEGIWSGLGLNGIIKTSATSMPSGTGAGGGYYGGQAVGYDPFNGNFSNQGGAVGYYAGAGYYGPGQSGSQGYGSGSSPASLSKTYAAGAGVGWTPGQGVTSGYYSHSSQVPTQQYPTAGAAWMPYSTAGVSQGGFSGQQGGYTGGFFGGRYGSQRYAAPGYAAGAYGGTAATQYYAGAYAGWDPVNGFQSTSWSGASPTGRGPTPGQPGGGLFGVAAVPGQLGSNGIDPSTGKPWSTNIIKGAYNQGASQSNPYGRVDQATCDAYRDAGML